MLPKRAVGGYALAKTLDVVTVIPPMPDETAENQPAGVETGSPCLQGERVAFTGTLASMTHRQAQSLVAEHGGMATASVSRQTTMLVVGEEGWPLEEDGRVSQKLQQVTDWRNEGIDARILNESEWLHLLGLEERRRDVHRLYTPAMLHQLLGVSVGTIRSWERTGLIRPVRKVYRLPYFDFQEVTSARRLEELLAAGVPRREIEAGLDRLRSVLPDVDRPLVQLEILARGAHVLYRDDHGLVQPVGGQRILDFDPPKTNDESAAAALSIVEEPAIAEEPDDQADEHLNWSADDWFREGCRALDDDAPDSALESFRMALMQDPGNPEVDFHLAEALYRQGNPRGALERYYAAVESDHNYLEAWTQLGCLHAELGELPPALDAFRIALSVHADYPDAHWHMADVLYQLGRTDEAVPHWQNYLKHDDRGPWAEDARQRLGEVDDAN